MHMDVMKPIVREDIPKDDNWLYEVKYDGFRCVLHWEKNRIKIISRNNKELTEKFPEIINYCHENKEIITKFLPLKMDGELVVLNNPYQANFSWIQRRGRLKSKGSIQKKSKQRPATFMAFDLLQYKGQDLYNKGFLYRKKLLNDLFIIVKLDVRIQLIKAYENDKKLWQSIYDYKGEGMIAKRQNSIYSEGKKHRDWYKIKNWRTIQGFLTYMDTANGYFIVGVYDEGEIKTIGKCKHGLDDESMNILKQIFITKGEKQGNSYTLPPAICTSIHTLDLYENELREPSFKELLPNTRPE